MTGRQVTQAVAAEVRILQFAFFEFVFCFSYFVFFCILITKWLGQCLILLFLFSGNMTHLHWDVEVMMMGTPRDRKMLKSNIVIPSSPRSSLTSFNPMYVGLYVG